MTAACHRHARDSHGFRRENGARAPTFWRAGMDEPTRILVERAQRRDEHATATLFARCRPRLQQALQRATAGIDLGGGADCEDLVQDACLAALRGLDSFRYRGSGSFLAWLLQTGHRALLQRLRHQRARKRSGPRAELDDLDQVDGAASTPSQTAQGHELERRIQVCLDRLPERERAAIVLRRYFDADSDEIQAELELPTAGAARALLSRAQARLARLLDETG